MRKLVILSVFFFLCASVAMPQPANTSTHKVSDIGTLQPDLTNESPSFRIIQKPVNEHLTIISDSRIDSLLKIHREENIRKGGIDGYRVQIFQGTKDNAYQMKSRFIARYDDIKVYVLFQSPDFRVRIGDFRNRSEAIKLKYLLEDDFPDAHIFIVDDVINSPCE
ncbi:MAG: SPOR domain-containing protein [Prolixibacteraceae bacterium]|nr:SPOR domain-containing protein [Prolixibacteraceae bacterium]